VRLLGKILPSTTGPLMATGLQKKFSAQRLFGGAKAGVPASADGVLINSFLSSGRKVGHRTKWAVSLYHFYL